MSRTNCYLCGSGEHFQRDGSVRDAPEVAILECSSCGLVFLESSRFSDPTLYEKSEMHQDEANIQDWLRQSEVDDERRFGFLSRAVVNKKLLDFGCGAGGFLQKSKLRAKYVAGIELDQNAVKYGRSQGLEIFSSLDDLNDHIFDVITAFHVIEHLFDPIAVLNKLMERLAEGGSLFVEVPNSDDALLSLYHCKPFTHFTYWSPHLYLFNRKTLSLLFKKARCHIEFIKNIQRYPLSNHLYWLSHGKPGGHQKWGSFMDSTDLNDAYEAQLASLGITDTLIVKITKQTQSNIKQQSENQ